MRNIGRHCKDNEMDDIVPNNNTHLVRLQTGPPRVHEGLVTLHRYKHTSHAHTTITRRIGKLFTFRKSKRHQQHDQAIFRKLDTRRSRRWIMWVSATDNRLRFTADEPSRRKSSIFDLTAASRRKRDKLSSRSRSADGGGVALSSFSLAMRNIMHVSVENQGSRSPCLVIVLSDIAVVDGSRVARPFVGADGELRVWTENNADALEWVSVLQQDFATSEETQRQSALSLDEVEVTSFLSDIEQMALEQKPASSHQLQQQNQSEQNRQQQRSDANLPRPLSFKFETKKFTTRKSQGRLLPRNTATPDINESEEENDTWSIEYPPHDLRSLPRNSNNTVGSMVAASSSASHARAFPARPLQYNLSLELDIPGCVVKGLVVLKCEVVRLTNIMRLHYTGQIHNIEFQKCADVSKDVNKPASESLERHRIPHSSIVEVDEQGTLDIALPMTLEPSSQFELFLRFAGSISLTAGNGIYCCFDRDVTSSRTDSASTSNNTDSVEGRRNAAHARSPDPNVHFSRVQTVTMDGYIGTHFEPQWCREVFPCVDHPSQKAQFKLSLSFPANLAAISCCEIETQEKVSRSSSFMHAGGLKRVHFFNSPVMPCYAFGFWVGPFKSKTVTAPGTQLAVTIYGVKSRMVHRSMDFSLHVASRGLDFFSTLFKDTPYPLNKLSLICMPRLYCMGMENFGAIAIQQDFAYTDELSTCGLKRRIERLLYHEISHQWYGDLATPSTWNDLWLKEGMARFLEFYSMNSVRAIETDMFTDGWDVWSGFIVEVMVPAMVADSLVSTHAVVVVEKRGDGGRDGLEEEERELESVIESFDTITYGKGAFLIRMLSLLVGVEVFTKAIARLVNVHQFKNTSRFDLWDAFEYVVAQAKVYTTRYEKEEETDSQAQKNVSSSMIVDGLSDETSLRDVMESWLLQPGFPELRVQLRNGTVEEQQNTQEEPIENEYPDTASSSTASDSDSVVSARSSSSTVEGNDNNSNAGSESGLSGMTLLISQTPYGTSEKTRGAHWIIPVAVRFAYVGQEADRNEDGNDDGAQTRASRSSCNIESSVVLASTEEVYWMEPGVSQLKIKVPAFAEIAGSKQFVGAEPQLCLIVNCHALAFLRVHYIGAATWTAVLAGLETPGVTSQVEKVCLVQNEIIAYVHAALPDRPVQLKRFHDFASRLSLTDQVTCTHFQLKHSVGQMPSCACESSASTARVTLLEFMWGLKVYSISKFIERAMDEMHNKNSNRTSKNEPDSSASTSSGSSSGSSILQTTSSSMVARAVEKSSHDAMSEEATAQHKKITAPDILRAVELTERLYKDIDSEIRTKGARPWVVESCLVVRSEVTELSRVLWQLAAQTMYAAVPREHKPKRPVKRFSSSSCADVNVKKENLGEKANLNPAFCSDESSDDDENEGV